MERNIKIIHGQIEELSTVNQAILNNSLLLSELVNSSTICINAFKSAQKILIAGNGGSAADAQHFAAELVSRFHFDRPALSAIALTTDSSILTAIGNDYGFEDVFARQIQAHGRPGDVFIAISTSGNSPKHSQSNKYREGYRLSCHRTNG